MADKIQWHPAFFAAMKLELLENKKDLDYYDEYLLNHKPLQVDILVIRKTQQDKIINEIGQIFRGHNLIEYKSSEDTLNLDTYIKVVGYACLYKSYEKHVGEIDLEDITLSFIREGYPRELMKWFEESKYVVKETFKGVYYIYKEGTFKTQIVVLKKLDKEVHAWLTSLTSRLEKIDVERLVKRINDLQEKGDKDCADSVLQVSIRANRNVFDRVKEEEKVMCEALRDLFKDEIDAEIDAKLQQNTEEVTERVTQQVTQNVTIKLSAENVVSSVETLAKNMKSSIEQACEMLGKTIEQYNEAKALLAKK